MSFTNPIVENPYPYAYAITATSPNTLYEAVESLVPGIYTITFSGGGTLNVDFYSGTTYIGTATSSSSPFLYNLATQATNFKFWCSTSSNIVISLTALALSETSGTLYTYTNSQTINLTGDAYVVLVGGGGGGGYNGSTQAGGGGSGGITGGRITLTGSLPLTIGAGGLGATSYPNNGQNGGNTTFGSYVAGGGGGGGGVTTPGAAGAAGSPNGGAGGSFNSSGSPSSNSNTFFSFFTQGTTGGGNGSQAYGTPAGSGIGSGGIAQTFPNATGYGSGGAGANNTTGGNGASGVMYLIL